MIENSIDQGSFFEHTTSLCFNYHYIFVYYTSMSLLDLVGHTPLYPLSLPFLGDVTVMAKLEWHNPSGSVKDRAASAMFREGLEHQHIPHKTLIEATSGNTGIAFATFGAALGVPVALALPENASHERKLLLKQLGVKLHLTSAMEGTDGAQQFVQALVAKEPDRYFYPDQYNNEANWKAHYAGTGPEIWSQTDGAVTHFVAGLGTTGTFVGTSRFLQEKDVTCIAVQPDNPMHGLEGWKHLDTALVPGIYDPAVPNYHLQVSTEKAFQYARAAFRFLGLFLSPSSAANLVAAIDVAKGLNSGCVVTVFPDNAMKYLQDPFWSNDDYLIDNPFV